MIRLTPVLWGARWRGVSESEVWSLTQAALVKDSTCVLGSRFFREVTESASKTMTDGWMGGWLCGWVSGWVSGWIDGRMNG